MALTGLVGDFRPWRKGYPELAERCRPHMPGIVDEAVAEIEREIPEYVRPHDPRYAQALRTGVDYALGHFIDLLADPDTPWDDALRFFYDVGAGEAMEGRNLSIWQGAMRLGARVGVRRLTDFSGGGMGELPTSLYGRITAAIFPYLEILAAAAAQGHADAMAETATESGGYRRKLLDALVTVPPPEPTIVRDLARRADWPMPRTVAAVALHERGTPPAHRPALPDEVLVGFHLLEPCLIVPDPDGPGRRRMLEYGLADWAAALGPTVEPAEVAVSLRWAREALAFARRGILPGDGLVVAADHMPTLVILQHEDLVERVGTRRLAPLLKVRPRQRYALAETLQACLASGFNATEVAGRLHMHAQTIRYRLRKLEELFGDDIYDPELRLEFQMVLHAWLAVNQPLADTADADR